MSFETARVLTRLTGSRPLQVAVLGLALTSFGVAFPNLESAFRGALLAAGITVVLAGIAIELMVYLRSSARAVVTVSGVSDSLVVKAASTAKADLDQLRREFEAWKNSAGSGNLTDLDRLETKERVAAKLSTDVVAEIASEWNNRFKEKAAEEALLVLANRYSDDMRLRLNRELETLQSRANLNLTIGSVTAIFGMIVLSFFIWETTTDLHNSNQLPTTAVQFAIRFSVVLLVEILSYFFLKLYRYSIFETKYFQNEITNADFRSMALSAAITSGDKKTVASVCIDMSKTERNFLLKKGETTIGLRRDELELQHELTLASELERILRAYAPHKGKPEINQSE